MFFTEFKTFSDSTETRLGELDGARPSHGDEGINESTKELIKNVNEQLQSLREEAEREGKMRKEMEEKMDQMRRDLQAAERRAKEALQKSERNDREIETVRKTAAEAKAGISGGGGGSVKVGVTAGKGGGWDVGRGNVEERVMMLEQRTEQQERETSSIKVRHL